jgi:hypothetical protein
MTTTAKAQAAQAIVGCSLAVREAMLHDPPWVRRMHHGDPTAVTDLVGRVCQSQGLDATLVAATIKADPALQALLRDTIATAQAQTAQERSQSSTWRLALIIGVVLVILLGAIIGAACYLHANSQAIKQFETTHDAPGR